MINMILDMSSKLREKEIFTELLYAKKPSTNKLRFIQVLDDQQKVKSTARLKVSCSNNMKNDHTLVQTVIKVNEISNHYSEFR